MQKGKNLKKYVELIAKKHGGIEGLRDVIKRKLPEKAGAAGMESFGRSADNKKAADQALKALEINKIPNEQQRFGLEAIINADLRPVIDIIGGKFKSEHPLWTQLSTNAGIRTRLETSIKSIGRIELPGSRYPYGGTGFLVGDGLIMTNRHVAELFASGVGNLNVGIKPGAKAGIDFVREHGQSTGTLKVYPVTKVIMIHPYWDMAILKVEGLNGTATNLTLSLDDGREMIGHDIAVVGYPAFDPRNPADVQNDLFHGRYGVKRLQPGELQGGMKAASFAKMVNAATHDCSTLGGNSGSALIDLTTGSVIALHFGGSYREQNFAVPTFEMARDKRIIDAGVKFAGEPSADKTDWAEWWRNADAQEASLTVTTDDSMNSKSAITQPPARALNSEDMITVEVPIRITVTVGSGRIISAAAGKATEATAIGDGLEKMVIPWHDTDYSTRNGYDSEFLNPPEQNSSLANVTVNMPTADDLAVLAKTRNGDVQLDYQNFSVLMHAKRRLALVTASNVTREVKLRKPEAGKDYTRKGLSGLGKSDVEEWYNDSRLGDEFQLPDVFFTKDRTAFDKGHIVRRDDVAWGETYEELRRANGDSYHATNCSPQVGGFNQSAKGEDNWGDLENTVLAQAANERLCVFAGPVLGDRDQIFFGTAGRGKQLQARIPTSFWKVIVSRVEDGIAAYGFILEQDLSDVQWKEFVVPPEFVASMTRLSEIEAMTGVRFDPAVLAADQHDTVRGVELTHRRGLRRRP